MNRTKLLFNEFMIFFNLMSNAEKSRNSKTVNKLNIIIDRLKKWCLLDHEKMKRLKHYSCYSSSYPIPSDGYKKIINMK